MKTLIFPSAPGVAHANGPLSDEYTLCGDALEGVNGDDIAYEYAGRVSCPTCIAIIEHCRKMPTLWKARKPQENS